MQEALEKSSAAESLGLEIVVLWGADPLQIAHVSPGCTLTLAGCTFSMGRDAAAVTSPPEVHGDVEPSAPVSGRQPGEGDARLYHLSQGQCLHLEFPRENATTPPLQCKVSLAPTQPAVGRGLLRPFAALYWGTTLASLALHSALIAALCFFSPPRSSEDDFPDRDQLYQMHRMLARSDEREVDMPDMSLEEAQATKAGEERQRVQLANLRSFRLPEEAGRWWSTDPYEDFTWTPDRGRMTLEHVALHALWTEQLTEFPRVQVVALHDWLFMLPADTWDLLDPLAVWNAYFRARDSAPSIGSPRSVDPSKARVRVVRAQTQGLVPEVVEVLARQKLGALRECYRKGLTDNPGLHGRVAIWLVVGTDGRVSRVGNAGTDLPDPTVLTCALWNLRTLRFPAGAAGIGTAVVRLEFTALQR